jgi:hypothetical protein
MPQRSTSQSVPKERQARFNEISNLLRNHHEKRRRLSPSGSVGNARGTASRANMVPRGFARSLSFVDLF